MISGAAAILNLNNRNNSSNYISKSFNNEITIYLKVSDEILSNYESDNIRIIKEYIDKMCSKIGVEYIEDCVIIERK